MKAKPSCALLIKNRMISHLKIYMSEDIYTLFSIFTTKFSFPRGRGDKEPIADIKINRTSDRILCPLKKM